ncbi:MAG: hypothetical protein FWB78_00370 [Treponema sp.]|nr:hypothetical protein [Treponema sp.]
MRKTNVARFSGTIALVIAMSLANIQQAFGEVSGPLGRMIVADPRPPIENWRVTPNNPSFNEKWESLERNLNTDGSVGLVLEIVASEHITPTRTMLEIQSGSATMASMLEQFALVEFSEYIRQLRQNNTSGYEQFRERLTVMATIAATSTRLEMEARGSVIYNGEPTFVWVGIVRSRNLDVSGIIAEASFDQGDGGNQRGLLPPHNDLDISGIVDGRMDANDRLQRLRRIMNSMLD